MTDVVTGDHTSGNPLPIEGAQTLPVAQIQIDPPKADEVKSKVDAAAADAAAEADDAAAQFTYTPTGDAGLDLALKFVGERGIGPEDAAFKAAMQGDFSLLKAKLAGMGAQAAGYSEYMSLAEKAYVDATEKANKEAQAATSAALSLFGPTPEEAQEAFTETAAWWKANGTKEEVAEINKMLKGSPMQARAAAALMKTAYSSASGVTRKPASAIDPNAAAGNKGAPAGPLSQKQFATETAKLAKQYGNGYDTTPEYKALWARVQR